MRILQIRFKNLNSLVGEWEIDLTHPAFASDGIFAITGPTGAGKTTILDAICLALYGRTPRLNKVTKSGNEIMSRQTGDCFAEVSFETQAGRYRCHWSQHRARKKPGGELQAAKHEIADADSGEIFEAKIRGVADRIETATGMDFDRFTRSMLLAQGGFAAFLQASPDKRAPILEQITGTDIYSKISVRVHELRSEENKKLEALLAKLAGMPLLTQEEEQQLSTGLEQKTQQDLALNQQIARNTQAINWIEGIDRLENELKQLGQKKEGLQTRVAAFAPEQERLRLANQALELSGGYSTLTAIRQEQETDQRSLGESEDSLPGREQDTQIADGAMKAATDLLEAQKTEQQKALPIIRKVRELDLKVAGKDTPISEANKSIADLFTSLETLRTKQDGDSAELDSKRKAIGELQQQLEATKADEGLVENLTGIRGQFETLQNLHSQLVGKLDEIKQADSQLEDASRVWQEQSTNLENEKRDLESIQVAQGEKKAELQKILENRELADWRKDQSLLSEQKGLLGKAIETVQSLLKSKKAVDELGSRKTALSTEESTLTNELESLAEKQTGLEKEEGLLVTQLTLLQKIEHLEEARHQLQDGEPCPLCGAKEHPFAEGNVPVPDETRQRLTTARGDLKSVNIEISDVKVKLARVGKDLEQLVSDQKEHAGRIEEANQLIVKICSELPPDLQLAASDPEIDEKLKGLQHDNAKALSHASEILQTAEALDKALNTQGESLEKARETAAKAESETQAAVHKKDSAGQLLERLKGEGEGYRDQQFKFLALLQQEVKTFGVETLSVENLGVVQEQLAFRRDQWITRKDEQAALEQKIAALEMQTSHQAEQIQKSEKERKKQRHQLNGLIQEREAFVREREDVFGDRKPDEEEARLSAAIDATDHALDAARKKLIAVNQEFSQLKSRVAELVKAIETRNIQLRSSDEAFLARLKEAGFSDEENYKSACLPENDRKNLTRQSQMLSNEKTALISKEREKTELLEMERQKQITEEPLDDIRNALATLAANLKELQQEIGGIQQKLKDNEALKQQQQERAQAIDAQKRECSRWHLLHELIGSSDGKKYRNFAQGLTFEMMIGYANRQLQKMTDRYLLVRDEAQPLELNVIDNYQAAEIRSTKNLSGGESFIVSLALALGLSHMTSKNVRVDSLFLDEGFGTLDEEALDTALETLAGLQQDGKLIGVISHVAALKERISTQIQVSPQTGGRSTIIGPGCERCIG